MYTEDGNRVIDIIHFRVVKDYYNGYDGNEVYYCFKKYNDLYLEDISAKGGATTVVVVTKDGSVHVGMSYCSNKDAYCKKTGREIAMRHADEAVKSDQLIVESKSRAITKENKKYFAQKLGPLMLFPLDKMNTVKI